MAPVALGIVGYGIMGERLLRAALDHDPAVIEVAGVWDPAPAARRRLADAFPKIPWLGSAAAVTDAADCVYVAAPPAAHLEHAPAALAHGRAVLCEKPLATDVEAARRFVEEAEAGGARAAVNFPFTASFAVDQLLAWWRAGALGRPTALAIELGFAAWPRPWQTAAAGWLDGRAEGGFTREVGSHFLFLARRLLGPLTLTSAAVECPPDGRSERAITATLRAGEVPVSLSGRVGGIAQPDHNLWTLEGTDGAIRLRDWSIAERRAADGTWQEAPDAQPNERMRPLILKRQLDQVARMTRGEPHHLATLREALEVQTIVEAILRH